MIRIDNFKVLEVGKKNDEEVIDYGIKMVGAPLEWRETMGEGVKVGIIDTGIDSDHPDLNGNIIKTKSFVGDSSCEDENGHGTHVAGCVAALHNGIGTVGVAPKAELYIAKAFDGDGNAQDSAVIDAIEWLTEEKVDVINMSFSGEGHSRRYSMAIKNAYEKGITLVSAAGNNGVAIEGDNIGYPARFDECIAVTAVDVGLKRCEFSSQGAKAEVAAVGVDVYSTYLDAGYATLSGTSMATPIISGAVAILQGKAHIRLNRKLTPQEIRLLLNIYADDLGIIGRSREYGFGIFSFGRICECENKEKIARAAECITRRAQVDEEYYKYMVAGMIAMLPVISYKDDYIY